MDGQAALVDTAQSPNDGGGVGGPSSETSSRRDHLVESQLQISRQPQERVNLTYGPHHQIVVALWHRIPLQAELGPHGIGAQVHFVIQADGLSHAGQLVVVVLALAQDLEGQVELGVGPDGHMFYRMLHNSALVRWGFPSLGRLVASGSF